MLVCYRLQQMSHPYDLVVFTVKIKNCGAKTIVPSNCESYRSYILLIFQQDHHFFYLVALILWICLIIKNEVI